MRRRRSALLALAALCAAPLAALPSGAAVAGPPPRGEWREVFSPDGSLTRVHIPVRAEQAPDAREREAAATAEVIPIRETGPSDRRFDVVVVGDGYTAEESATLRRHAEEKWAEIAATAPWNRYVDGVNVWLVNVVSRESGVDHDPQWGVYRDTALDMHFFCGGTERLLCLNESKAQAYAAQAPDADAVIAVGNTTKYGGAGYPSLATVAGGNAQAGRIAIHELGHSVGGLADEYYTPGTTYTGGEPSAPNVTRSPNGAKWSDYHGRTTPDGGVIGAFQGAHYHEYGIYRPSQDSLMRNINKPFNLVGLDVMDRAISAEISGLPGADCTGHEHTRTGSLSVGGSAGQPDGSYFGAVAGTHRACLRAPEGSRFTLSLLHWDGGAWRTVATADADGRLEHTGARGSYAYRVRAESGSGAYTLGYDVP
ncbi:MULTISPECIES: M64 family metallopeptidase [unclassified Streptomyces]|uniref:M64 family metallopeptidase n=1 Tax=unclassified Streptomyces TaxID=2593676 RepID=UPI0022B69FBD|nr:MULTISPECIES: M64 family metallopeptidase [unclassified Streptomyces]MCZ7417103.1 M64 family metallo-endopeptidase [Streptomyces sp. WMMC897]MCZ7433069.1 M64 family metallo-endopeptidase [Streptomyces sp. WMMC1477]